jgi:hypothetical protein
MFFKRIAALLFMTLGILGVVACLLGIYGVWIAGSRLNLANDKVFAAVDRGLASGQEHIRGVQKRVQESKITTSEISAKLRDWSITQAKERLAAELEIERRTEKLSGQLQVADTWLQTSSESVRSVQQLLEVGNSLGARLDPAALEEVLEALAKAQNALQKTQVVVEEVRDFATGKEEEASRLARVMKLLERALLTIGQVDTRLENPIKRLAEMRTEAHELKSTVYQYILWTTVGCCLLLCWIAAGQAALLWCGWKSF